MNHRQVLGCGLSACDAQAGDGVCAVAAFSEDIDFAAKERREHHGERNRSCPRNTRKDTKTKRFAFVLLVFFVCFVVPPDCMYTAQNAPLTPSSYILDSRRDPPFLAKYWTEMVREVEARRDVKPE